MKLLLSMFFLASSALAQDYVEEYSPVQEPLNHLKPKYVRCDGRLIELPATTQMPISCEDALRYEAPAFSKACDDKINQIIRCYDKYKSKGKRAKCVAK